MTPPISRTDAPDQVASGSGPQEQDRLITEHIPLVHHLVRETLSRVPSHVSGDDLVSAGLLALTQAAQAFEVDRGAKFATFAAARIRGAILDELRSMDWASRSVRRRARQIEAAQETLAAQKGRTATDEEISADTGLSVHEVRGNKDSVARAALLSLQGFADTPIDDVVPGRGPSPEELLETREQVALLVDAIACLPHRLRKVVEDYFFAERAMAEIAADLGVTESRVSQMRAEALERLRGALEHALDGPSTTPASSHSSSASSVAQRRRQTYFTAVAERRTMAARLTSVN